MHVPDGFFDAPTSIATGAVAAVTVGFALRGARRELDDRTVPLTGVVAAFVFAGQMMMFPVGAGTSGHLLGGVLAAVLVGPWTAILVMTVVLGVQGVFFADGGLTALGTNIVLIGLVAVVAGWWMAKLGMRALARFAPEGSTRTVVPATFIAALLSVPVAALAFVGLYAIGGAAPIPLGALTGAMVGVHLVIGLGEAAITAATVGAVLAVRPDLVYAARPLLVQRTLELR